MDNQYESNPDLAKAVLDNADDHPNVEGQFERYAHQLVFWKMQLENALQKYGFESGEYYAPAKYYNDLVLKINEKYAVDTFDMIMKRVDEIRNVERNKEISDLKKKFKIINDVSVELYDRAKDIEICRELKDILVEPGSLMFQQNNFRQVWEKYGAIENICHMNHRKYFQFMYDSLPPKFAEIWIGKRIMTGIVVPEEVFYEALHYNDK